MGLFGTSMSAHHILELEKVPRVRLFADLKVVRELGLERRETVWSLSVVIKKKKV
jgi:hypothetical protein